MGLVMPRPSLPFQDSGGSAQKTGKNLLSGTFPETNTGGRLLRLRCYLLGLSRFELLQSTSFMQGGGQVDFRLCMKHFVAGYIEDITHTPTFSSSNQKRGIYTIGKMSIINFSPVRFLYPHRVFPPIAGQEHRFWNSPLRAR